MILVPLYIFSGDVYTKVKVQELWATYVNDPLAGTKFDLIAGG